MAKGADVHAGQSSSPTAAAEADDVATVGEGMVGADDACGVVQAARRVRPMAVEVKRDMAEKWRVRDSDGWCGVARPARSDTGAARMEHCGWAKCSRLCQ